MYFTSPFLWRMSHPTVRFFVKIGYLKIHFMIIIMSSIFPIIKGPDNPTSQLLPKMSFNGLSGDREGRKDKDKGRKDKEGSVSVCEVIVFKYVYV